jgi:DNA replication protein DnaC
MRVKEQLQKAMRTRTATNEPTIDCDACRSRCNVEEICGWWNLCNKHLTDYRQAAINRLLNRTIPQSLQSARIEHLPEHLQKWNLQSNHGVYLYGPVGTGKSYAAAALIRKAVEQLAQNGELPSAAWVNIPIAIQQTLSLFGKPGSDPSAIWDAAQTADILVMDDIGMEQPKEWIRTRLYVLVEHRLNNQLPTIVTSNLSQAQLGDRLGSPQVASRLTLMTAQASFGGADRRKGLSPRL